jgi:ketosteroid isomerase-like protein
MSLDAAQVVSKLLESSSKQDLATLKSLWAPDCVLTTNYPAHLPFSGDARGPEAIIALQARMVEPFENLGGEIKALVAQGDTAILILEETLRTKATGKLVENKVALTVKVRDSQIVSAFALGDTYAISEAFLQGEAATPPRRSSKPAGKAKKKTVRAAPKGKSAAGKNTLKASGKGSARTKKKKARARA